MRDIEVGQTSTGDVQISHNNQDIEVLYAIEGGRQGGQGFEMLRGERSDFLRTLTENPQLILS